MATENPPVSSIIARLRSRMMVSMTGSSSVQRPYRKTWIPSKDLVGSLIQQQAPTMHFSFKWQNSHWAATKKWRDHPWGIGHMEARNFWLWIYLRCCHYVWLNWKISEHIPVFSSLSPSKPTNGKTSDRWPENAASAKGIGTDYTWAHCAVVYCLQVCPENMETWCNLQLPRPFTGFENYCPSLSLLLNRHSCGVYTYMRNHQTSSVTTFSVSTSRFVSMLPLGVTIPSPQKTNIRWMKSCITAETCWNPMNNGKKTKSQQAQDFFHSQYNHV